MINKKSQDTLELVQKKNLNFSQHFIISLVTFVDLCM